MGPSTERPTVDPRRSCMRLEFLLKTLLTFWFALTILRCLNLPRLRVLAQFDIFGLIPNWGFFGHQPVEFRVVYRTIDRQGIATNWAEVDFLGTRTWREGLWHPLKRVEKSFAVNPRNIARLCLRNVDRQVIALSRPYLAVLNQVRQVARNDCRPEPLECQFSISRTIIVDGASTELLVMQSNMHDVD
jgi:hypothetical protein